MGRRWRSWCSGFPDSLNIASLFIFVLKLSESPHLLRLGLPAVSSDLWGYPRILNERIYHPNGPGNLGTKTFPAAVRGTNRDTRLNYMWTGLEFDNARCGDFSILRTEKLDIARFYRQRCIELGSTILDIQLSKSPLRDFPTRPYSPPGRWIPISSRITENCSPRPGHQRCTRYHAGGSAVLGIHGILRSLTVGGRNVIYRSWP